MPSRASFLASCFLLLPACNASAPSASAQGERPSDGDAEAGAPAPADVNDGFLRLQVAEDEDPDPSVVEVSLTARETELSFIEGRPHPQRAYNGTVPGPLIRANVGDTLVVHFENELQEPTTIHWHGLRLPNGMDGVPGVTQEVVEPGGSFRYEYDVLDASAFWYHPHFQTLEQVGDGLYGALIVSDPEAEQGLGIETVMAISDVSLFEDGSVQVHPDTAETTILGREGATLLVNGHTQQRMEVVSGQRLRWRVLNMARSRYLELALAGHRFVRIGEDGGLNEAPISEATTRLVPGERVDLVVEPRGTPGSHIDLVTLPVDRGSGASTSIGPEVLVRLEFVDAKEIHEGPLVVPQRELSPYPIEGADEVQIELTSSTGEHGVTMGINGVPYSGHEAHGQHDSDGADAEHQALRANVGTPQIWNVMNATGYDHPFHLHGFHFQVVDAANQPESPLRSKDTINIPAHQTVRLVPGFDERVGSWMFHCHILDHAEAGMMGVLELSDSDPRSGWDTPPGTTTEETTRVWAFEDYAAFLDSAAYRQLPWVAETEEPRPRNTPVSPHGTVRVYANDVLLASIAKGNLVEPREGGGWETSTDGIHDTGSMAVKEFYSGDELLGRALIRKLEGDNSQTAYYCDGPQNLCGIARATPAYGEGFELECGFCHGGLFFTVNFPER